MNTVGWLMILCIPLSMGWLIVRENGWDGLFKIVGFVVLVILWVFIAAYLIQ